MKSCFNYLYICIIIVNLFIETSLLISYETLLQYLNVGQYELIEQWLNDNENYNKSEMVMKLKNEINERMIKMNDIENKYINIKHNVTIITPAIKWAENSRYIYLQIQYKEFHTQNDILCMNVDLENFELLTDSNYIHFSGYCFNNKYNHIFKFELSLLLKSNLNQLKSLSHNITPTIKGVYTVLLYKSENMYWGSLIKYPNTTNIDIIKIDESIFETIN